MGDHLDHSLGYYISSIVTTCQDWQEDSRDIEGGRGESERAREKEIKRRRERGTGAVESSNGQWQHYFSKDMSWFKVDIPQMGQTSTRVPESSLLTGLTSKMCPLQSLLHTGRQV